MLNRLPLRGVRVLELAGLAPVPYCGKILADFGADVVRVDRSAKDDGYPDVLCRGKKSIGVNLKSARGREALLNMLGKVDVLVEPFRPGVMEKLGLGPEVALERNPRLVYARLTGFGQTGALKDLAGHDINYLSVTGVLDCLRRKGEKPLPPINLLADFAGGGMSCAMGIVLALFERSTSQKGQVVDAAMVDAVANFATFLWNFEGKGLWNTNTPGANLLDTGAPFYDTYECKDGKFVAVGAIEPHFYAEMIKLMELADEDLPGQMDMSEWETLRSVFNKTFRLKTRDEWAKVFDGSDACVTPVLSMTEAQSYPHNVQRKSFRQTQEGDLEPIPAPRLSAMEIPDEKHGYTQRAANTKDILKEYGFSEEEIASLLSEGAIYAKGFKSKL